MSDFQLNDPTLNALESRLTSVAPRAASSQQHELLYQCGYAAGRQSVRTSFRCWQALAAGFFLAAVGSAISLALQSQSPVVAEKPAEGPDKVMPVAPSDDSFPPSAVARSQTDQLPLDAWQVPADYKRETQVSTVVHPLAVGSLTRSLTANGL